MTELDIAEFLRARLDEDEAARSKLFDFDRDAGGPDLYVGNEDQLIISGARVFREVEAKRRILDAYEETAASVAKLTAERAHGAIVMSVEAAMTALQLAVRYHAAVYDQHPDYRPEWRL